MQKITRVVGGRARCVEVEDEVAKSLLATNNETLICNYVAMVWREQNRDRAESRRHQSFEQSEENGYLFADLTVDVEQDCISNIEREQIQKAICQLLPQQQELLRRVYFNDESQIDIANDLHISHQAVANRLKKILEKLKKLLN